MNVLLFLLVGVIAGTVATRVKAAPRPWLFLALGSSGALLGGFILSSLGPFARGFYGSLLTATAGAALLLFVAGLRRASRPVS